MDDACYCDFDPPIFYHKTDVTAAREAHACNDCGRAILPGESYERVRALWERGDSPQTLHTCAWCVDLRDWITAHVPCFCYMHGGLMTMVQEELDNNYEARDTLKPEIDAMLAEIRARPTLRQFEEGR